MNNKFPVSFTFKENGLFYEMVSSCMVAIAASPAIFLKYNPMKYKRGDCILLTGKLYKGASVYPLQIYNAVLEGYISQDHFRHSLCMMLANLAYESVKVKGIKTKSPKWELLRHIRNASSHNNRFNFDPKKDEPKWPTYWNKLVIDHKLKGQDNPLFGKACFGEFMEMAELIWLLKDIEDSPE